MHIAMHEAAGGGVWVVWVASGSGARAENGNMEATGGYPFETVRSFDEDS